MHDIIHVYNYSSFKASFKMLCLFICLSQSKATHTFDDGPLKMLSVRCGLLNNRLFQPASLSRSLTSSELRRLKSIKLYCIVPSLNLSQTNVIRYWMRFVCPLDQWNIIRAVSRTLYCFVIERRGIVNPVAENSTWNSTGRVIVPNTARMTA